MKMGIVILTFLLFGIYILIYFTGCNKSKDMVIPDPIRNLDCRAVLSTCREMINNRRNYQNDRGRMSHIPKNAIVLDPSVRPWGNEIPLIIQQMKPLYVIIYEDRMLIYLEIKPRIVLFAFSEGVKENGTVKLIDGLWYSNGHEMKDR